jgi:predicted dinucleotide-binding enzyme
MRIGVLGTGAVGTTLATALQQRGHDVRLGSRSTTNADAAAWAARTGGSHGTFADAAEHGEVVISATKGEAAVAAIRLAGAERLGGKVLIDVSNPLAFGPDGPHLFTTTTESLAERVQAAAPDARVVKALCHVDRTVMVDPGRVGGPSDTFLCGDDADAKAVVTGLLRELGWASVVDLGDLTAARALEPYVLLWIRLWRALGTADFNVRLVRG